jgi:hypothetical protein
MGTKDANTLHEEAVFIPYTADSQQFAELEQCIQVVRENAKHTGTYVAALLSTGITVPVFAAFLSILLYLTHFQFPGLTWLTLWATVGGSLFVLLCWLLFALPFKRFTAVDRANADSYEQLLNRFQQAVAWYETLMQKPIPETNSLYTIGKREIWTSLCMICKKLQAKGPLWIYATGYTSLWKLMHRIDEAFIEIEPVEAVIHNALHDEMSLQDSTLTNREDLLNKLRRAVKILDQGSGAAVYLNQQPPQEQKSSQAFRLFNKIGTIRGANIAQAASTWPSLFSLHVRSRTQDDQTRSPGSQTTSSAMQNTVNLKENDTKFSNKIDPATQARTMIYEVRTTLHHFRDDRWDKLIRVRNQLMKMTLVTGLLLYVLVEFAVMINVGAETLKAATILFFVGGLVGLFSRLYDQSKTDTSIEDYRLASARLIAAPLYSGLSAIGGVLVIQRTFDLSVASILIAAAFGLTPSLFTSAIQKEADQYKTDLKSTTAPTGAKPKNS